MPSYLSGTIVRSIANFADVNGALADPTTVTLKYQIQGGSVQSVSPLHDSIGVFHFDFDTTGFTGSGAQLYTLLWKGAGAIQIPGVDTFTVTALPF
jgi:hypothetical protein